MLYIVSTPIGNLKDISFRAVEVLKEVDLIAAEDTRHTGKLCAAYDIHTKLTSCFDHNEHFKIPQLIQFMIEGKSVALVSDAGTPGISDPGYRLINEAKANNIAVTVVPGPTALIAALTLSGLPSDRFIFEGFLPVKSAARRKKLESLGREERTIIFYESPHRILKTLKDIQEVLNDPEVTLVREITKKFEEVKKAKASELVEQRPEKFKGEFVVCLNLK